MDHRSRSLPMPAPRSRRRTAAVAGAAAVLVLGAGLTACGSDKKADEEETSSVTGRLETTTTTASSSDTTTKQSGSNGGGTSSGGSSSGGGGSSSGSTPTIGSFTTPEDVDCHNGNLQQVSVSWTTTNATKVTISIDGPGVYDTYPANGSTSLPFNCSSSHTWLLTAYGSDGSTTTTQVTLQPRNAQGSTSTTA
jgi:hypothetical protein